MTSFNPPPLTPKISTRNPGEPASEWASSTLAAIEPIAQPETESEYSVPTTPGYEVPGAFPGPHLKPSVVQQDAAYVKEAALNALQTAKGYVPTTTEVKKALSSAGETVGGYLPQSVAAYLPGTYPETQTSTSLPSEELGQNAHPAPSGGAGTLPGPPGESGVALLPDERTQTNNTATTTHSHDVNAPQTSKGYVPSTTEVKKVLSSAGETVAGYLPQSVAAYLPGTNPETQTRTTLPSEELGQNAHPASSGGVGTLPGPPGEIGVAVLPDERTYTNNAATTPLSDDVKENSLNPSNSGILRASSGIALLPEERRQNTLPSHDDDPNFSTLQSDKRGGVGSLPGYMGEVGVAKLPDERKEDEKQAEDKEGSLKTDSESHGGSGASTDASTRSLAGSRIDTPGFARAGASLPGVEEHPQSHLPNIDLVQPSTHTPANTTLDSNIKPDSTTNTKPIATTTNTVPHTPTHPTTAQTTARTHPLAADGAKYHGVPLSEGYQRALDGDEERGLGVGERKEPKIHIGEARRGDSEVATPGHGDGSGAPAVPKKDSLATMAMPVKSSPNTSTNTSMNSKTTSSPTPSKTDKGHGHARTGSTSSTGKKSGFLDKLKGEVKVLSGKLGHNEEKVEEGRRLMQGRS